MKPKRKDAEVIPKQIQKWPGSEQLTQRTAEA